MAESKQTRTTADLLVECLEEEGVHYYSVYREKKI